MKDGTKPFILNASGKTLRTNTKTHNVFLLRQLLNELEISLLMATKVFLTGGHWRIWLCGHKHSWTVLVLSLPSGRSSCAWTGLKLLVLGFHLIGTRVKGEHPLTQPFRLLLREWEGKVCLDREESDREAGG